MSNSPTTGPLNGPPAGPTNGPAGFAPTMMLAPGSLAVARARLLATTEAAPVVHLSATMLLDGAEPLPPLSSGGVLVADHVLWAGTERDVARVVRALEPEQALIFLEPTADVGWRRGLHRAMAWLGPTVWRRIAGHHFEQDVPATLRATGITVTDTVRFNAGPFQLFSYVYGRAVSIEPAPS